MKKLSFFSLLLCMSLGLTQCHLFDVIEPPIIATIVNNSEYDLFLVAIDGDRPDTIHIDELSLYDCIHDRFPAKTQAYFAYCWSTRDEYLGFFTGMA